MFVCVKTGFFSTIKLMVMPMLCCKCLVPICTFRVRKTYGFGKVLTRYVTLTFNIYIYFFFIDHLPVEYHAGFSVHPFFLSFFALSFKF